MPEFFFRVYFLLFFVRVLASEKKISIFPKTFTSDVCELELFTDLFAQKVLIFVRAGLCL